MSILQLLATEVPDEDMMIPVDMRGVGEAWSALRSVRVTSTKDPALKVESVPIQFPDRERRLKEICGGIICENGRDLRQQT